MFLKKKKYIWLICSIPFWIVVIQAFMLTPFVKKFWSQSISITGYSAAVLLALSLSFSPLHKHFPKSQFFAILNRHKRGFGDWAKMWGWGYQKFDQSPDYSGLAVGHQVLELIPDEPTTQKFHQEWKAL